MAHRRMGSHELNLESSRSHSIMTIHCDATPVNSQVTHWFSCCPIHEHLRALSGLWHGSTVGTKILPVESQVEPATMRLEGTAKVPADCNLKYYRISECLASSARHASRSQEARPDALFTVALLDVWHRDFYLHSPVHHALSSPECMRELRIVDITTSVGIREAHRDLNAFWAMQNPEQGVRYGKVSFVDLAGSERLRDTKSTGDSALKETSSINRSLFTLGKVGPCLHRKASAGSVICEAITLPTGTDRLDVTGLVRGVRRPLKYSLVGWGRGPAYGPDISLPVPLQWPDGSPACQGYGSCAEVYESAEP